MSKVKPGLAVPLAAFSTPFSSTKDEEAALRKHLETVSAIQVHGIRTGDGPGETFVILEFPAATAVPTNVAHPHAGLALTDDRRNQPVAITLADTMGNEFDWGHSGIQCRNLAAAILSRVKSNQGVSSIPDEIIAKFTTHVIANLDRYEWTLTFQTVERWCAANITTGVPE